MTTEENRGEFGVNKPVMIRKWQHRVGIWRFFAAGLAE
jgi:hypothetical protein